MGEHIGDSSRNLFGRLGVVAFRDFCLPEFPFYIFNDESLSISTTIGSIAREIGIDVSMEWPVAHEFRSTSISALICISY